MTSRWNKEFGLRHAVGPVWSFLRNGAGFLSLNHWPDRECDVPADFFGVCVAGTEDPAGDDYIVERLRQLGVRNVRVDYTASSQGTALDPFLRRLLSEKFQVGLHLVQTQDAAAAMDRESAQALWRKFLRDVVAAYGRQVAFIEIGSTCNRRRWSGYSIGDLLTAWRIVRQEIRDPRIRLAAPNVTDFEPFYNIAILGRMKREGLLPDIHTDNLFVERATEPEAYDPKILGRRLAGFLKANLIKKARTLGAISAWAGVPETMCSHVSWSLRRIARFLGDLEEHQADYLARYACLAAASGALQKVFWGPLIGQREGLIDDGTALFPVIPHVTLYARANGKVSDYRVRPAFLACATVSRLIGGGRFVRRIPSDYPLHILEFVKDNRRLHAVWTTNGHAADAARCYDKEALARMECLSRDGVRLNLPPRLFTESPVYLTWPVEAPVPVVGRPGVMDNIRMAAFPGTRYAPVQNDAWRGIGLMESNGRPVDVQSLFPERLPDAAKDSAAVMRNSRNLVWSVPAPWNRMARMVVKRFRPQRWWRRLLDCRKPGRALRSWSGAMELSRRGVGTPRPVAFFEHPLDPKSHESYYLCEAFEGGWSIRDAFTAYAGGNLNYRDFTAFDLYKALAMFLVQMHDRGVFFRDLSAGNVLFREKAEAEIEFALIDTTRARFYSKSLGLRRRLADLIRICHPLNWKERRRFLGDYMSMLSRGFSGWMQVPFMCYDLKHGVKKWLKGWRKMKLTAACVLLAGSVLLARAQSNEETTVMTPKSDKVVRTALGAGRWFPGDSRELKTLVDGCIAGAGASAITGRIVAAISPHAGYVYSGKMAGVTFRALKDNAARVGLPDVVVVVGFSHQGSFGGIALLDGDAVSTPLGEIRIDRESSDALVRGRSRIRWDYRPHCGEHSAENQIPFVQAALPGVPVVVAMFGDHDSRTKQELSAGLAELAQVKKIVVVSSSDMLHDPDYDLVSETDRETLKRVEAMDMTGLLKSWSYEHQIFCGMAPVLAAMQFAQGQGCKQGTVLQYRNSGDDHPESRGQWVVGYGAVVFAVQGK